MIFSNKHLAGLIVVGALGAWYLTRKASAAAVAAGSAINPVNPDNIFYGGVNEIGGAIAGEKSWSLGSWLYDVTHPNEVY